MFPHIKQNIWRYVYAVIFSYTFSPIIFALVGNFLAFIFSCGDLNEGSIPDCPNGNIIYALTLMPWLLIVTLPTGVAILLFVFVTHFMLWSRRARKEAEQKAITE